MTSYSTAQAPAEPGAGLDTGGGVAQQSLSSQAIITVKDNEADTEAKACCGCVHAPRRRKVLHVFGAALVCFAGGWLLGSMQGEAVG